MSTYFPNIPQAGDNPSDTQPQLLSNFQALDAAIDRNHKSLSDTANSGRHEVVEMEEQSSDPTPVATYGSLYVKDDGGTQNLYMIDDASTIHQFTNAFTAATSGELTIPGGLVLKWGFEGVVTNGQTITYPTPFSSATYNVQISSTRGDAQNRIIHVNAASVSAASFAVQTDSSNLGMYWLAIGS